MAGRLHRAGANSPTPPAPRWTQAAVTLACTSC
ncbi:CxxxxCH/CxxCH domain-containing protein [Hyphomonas sp.]